MRKTWNFPLVTSRPINRTAESWFKKYFARAGGTILKFHVKTIGTRLPAGRRTRLMAA
jgi:hypothetical protein